MSRKSASSNSSNRKPSEIMKDEVAEVRRRCALEADGPLGPTFRDPDNGERFGGPMHTDPDFDFSIFDGSAGRMMGKDDYEEDCPTCQAFREMDRANGFDVD